jgi:hypothetical protein
LPKAKNQKNSPNCEQPERECESTKKKNQEKVTLCTEVDVLLGWRVSGMNLGSLEVSADWVSVWRAT